MSFVWKANYLALLSVKLHFPSISPYLQLILKNFDIELFKDLSVRRLASANILNECHHSIVYHVIRKNNRPGSRMLRFGALDFTGAVSDSLLSSITVWVLSLGKSTKLKSLLDTSNLQMFVNRLLWLKCQLKCH